MPLRRTMRLAWSTHRGERKVSGKMVNYAYPRMEQFPCHGCRLSQRLYEAENMADSGTTPQPRAQTELPLVSVFFTFCKIRASAKFAETSNYQSL